MYKNNKFDVLVQQSYADIRCKNKEKLENSNKELYAELPQIQKIDDEISALAIKHAARIIKENITPEDAVKAVAEEKQKLISQRNDIIEKSGYKFPDSLEYDCRKCNDTGYINGKRCDCYYKVLNNALSKKLSISENFNLDFEVNNFDKFSLEWFSTQPDPKFKVSPHENMRAVLKECKMFCYEFDKNKTNLYFYGNSGTGKTFMANCIACDLLLQGYSVSYQSAYHMFQFMEDFKFGKISREENQKKFDSIYNSDLLIIDDLGTEFATSYTCSVLFDILNTRLIRCKSTIISTNLSVNKLSEKYTDRVSSRIIGEFEMMRFIGDDIRIKKKLNRR